MNHRQLEECIKHPPAIILSKEESLDNKWQILAKCSNIEARKFIPFHLAQKYCVLPISLLEDTPGFKVLNVIIGGSIDAGIIQELKFAIGFEIVSEVADYETVEKAIFAAYKGGANELKEALFNLGKEDFEKSPFIEFKFENKEIQGPVPHLLDALINRGVSIRASDIHLEPKGSGFRVRYRVDGILQEEADFLISFTHGQNLIRRIKVLAKLDLTEKHSPQESGFTFEVKEWSLRLRVSIIPQLNSFKVVLRLLDNQFLKTTLENNCSKGAFAVLGLNSDQQRLLLACLESNSGVIIASGPTGSGKSTLLYAALNYLNVEWRNIVTIEDPVERMIPGVNQADLFLAQGISCHKLLVSLLRQDPDIIMVGEMRDQETAATALEAGITGHLVLTTIHAGSCFEVLDRLTQLGIDSRLMAGSLRLILSQRLLPKNCRGCLVRSPASEELVQFFRFSPDTSIWSSVGCQACRGTGVEGRLGVFEFLPIGPILRDFIVINYGKEVKGMLNNTKMREAALQNGYRSFMGDIREALLKGIVSPQAALRVLGIAPDFFGY